MILAAALSAPTCGDTASRWGYEPSVATGKWAWVI